MEDKNSELNGSKHSRNLLPTNKPKNLIAAVIIINKSNTQAHATQTCTLQSTDLGVLLPH
jgi:hypothetical protein